MSNLKKIDGMRYPSIDELLTKDNSKYRLAVKAASRAKEIELTGDKDVFDYKCIKPVGKALEEILYEEISE